MKKKINKNNFTMVEAGMVLGILAIISFWGVVIYVAWHFISKFW